MGEDGREYADNVYAIKKHYLYIQYEEYIWNRGMVLYLAMAMITCVALMVLAIGLGQEVKET